jgi:hypothetical protein
MRQKLVREKFPNIHQNNSHLLSKAQKIKIHKTPSPLCCMTVRHDFISQEKNKLSAENNLIQGGGTE